MEKIKVKPRKDFSVDREYKLKQELERVLNDSTISFRKNLNKYDKDFEIFKAFDVESNGNHYEKLIAFLEVERSDSWLSGPMFGPGWPRGWSHFQFFKKKIFKFDWTKDDFTDEIVDNSRKTLYLHMNYEMTYGYIAKVYLIAQFKRTFVMKRYPKFYQNVLLRTECDDDRVFYGTLKECANYVERFVKSLENSQIPIKCND